MLFLIPGNPGERYIKSLFGGRFLFGVVPTLASAVLVVIVGWIWDRSNGSGNVKATIGTILTCGSRNLARLDWRDDRGRDCGSVQVKPVSPN
jgi:hypothetical protein